jgi:Nucleotidyl transferase AbiEii toxin, Type IV TA system
MNQFQARYDILPEPQKRLWPELKQVPSEFVLYGGTGIALRLGHRQSADFDFFSSETVVPERLLASIPFLAGAKILQNEGQTLTVTVQRAGIVKVSFFGGLTLGRVQDPEETSDGILVAASLVDLAGLKAAVVQKRAEAKDYIDILAMMDHGITLPTALGVAQALYGEQYNPMVTLKALAYFGDGDLHTLSPQQRDRLTKAASERFEIPEIKRVAETLHVC